MIEIIILKNAASIPLILFFTSREKRSKFFTCHNMDKQELSLFFLKNLSLFLMLLCFLGSLIFLPATTLAVVQNLQTYFCSVFAFIFLKEQILMFEIISMTVCFFSVVLIILSRENTSEKAKSNHSVIYYILPILVAVFMSIFTTLTRKLKRLDAEYSFFWLAMSLVLFSLPLEIIQLWKNEPLIETLSPPNIFGYSGQDYFVICVISASAYTLGQYCQNTALQRSKVGAIIALLYMTVFYTFVIDVLFMGESFNALEIFGTLVIVVTSVVVTLKKQKSKDDEFQVQK